MDTCESETPQKKIIKMRLKGGGINSCGSVSVTLYLIKEKYFKIGCNLLLLFILYPNNDREDIKTLL